MAQKIFGTITATGTLHGVLSARKQLKGTLRAGKPADIQDYANDADILALFEGGNE
jgi:hypothetical protein